MPIQWKDATPVDTLPVLAGRDGRRDVDISPEAEATVRAHLATARVEELVRELKERFTVVIVTHNMQQAARISDQTCFFLMGDLVEVGPTQEIFTSPTDRRTEDYITGRFG